ncbi:MAG: hypothetical protein U1F15_06165 [Burkholderiales bacterium]
MHLDSVRELKADVRRRYVARLTLDDPGGGMLAHAAQPTANLAGPRRTIALGITRKGKKDFQLAVRVQRAELVRSAQLDAIVKKAKGEADVRYVGRLYKRMPAGGVPWTRKNRRPLQIGLSIGHYRITAGTLGCFVRRRSDGALLILSNNHVLANENDAAIGDPILQRASLDGGRRSTETVGTLAKFVRLKSTRPNVVDCAVAAIDDGIECNLRALKGLGKLAGMGPFPLDDYVELFKVGRTTQATRGRMTAFELDNVVFEYDMGNITFDDQIEIEGAGRRAFSDGGDSGSLIVDADRKGVALLFGGGDQGGSNGMGLTYATPLKVVLDKLKVDLAY